MSIRQLDTSDALAWLRLRQALWPDEPAGQLAAEIEAIAADPRQVALGGFLDQVLVGFVELSLHPHAVGCQSSPVAYLEAWYVDAAHRRGGLGRRLVAAGEEWARNQGCRELASDTWLDNATSHRAHLALGFAETARFVHYRKDL